MVTTTTSSGSRIALLADRQQAFAVADRTGLSLDLIHHVFGAPQPPHGARGVCRCPRRRIGVPRASRLGRATLILRRAARHLSETRRITARQPRFTGIEDATQYLAGQADRRELSQQSAVTSPRGRSAVAAAHEFFPRHSYSTADARHAHFMGVRDGLRIWALD
jgi:hypothetical protein